MKTLIKYTFLLVLVALSSHSYAQLRISDLQSTPLASALNSSAFIDASSDSYHNGLPNIGKGLLFPRTDLTKFTFSPTSVGSASNYPTRFDGMIVYNTATSGTALDGSTSGTLSPGFWYYENKSGDLTGGTWKPLGSANSSSAGSSSAATASNGLSIDATSSDVQLGGTLTKATTVALAANNLLFSSSGGKVAVGGTAVPATTSAQFEVNGASANSSAYNAESGMSIDFSKSNLAYTTASAGAFTLQNLKDGATYTLAVQGTTSGTSTFTATNTASATVTCKTLNNRPTNGDALYTIIVMGTTAYIYVATGFN